MTNIQQNQIDQAVANFQGGFNCAQAVFAAYASQYGLEIDTAHKIAAPFGGGMGRCGHVCGAISGALMVIGLQAGNTQADDKAGKERAYNLAQDFLQRFEANQGSTQCRDLIGFDLTTPEGLQAARQANIFATRCPPIVRQALELLAELL